jgi:acylphosphatase
MALGLPCQNMVGKHILVSGRVQGVGFRYFTSQVAREIGLVGWVRNLPDGRVEVLAFGSEDQLADLMEDLAVGPPGSAIGDLSVQDVDMQQPLQGFSIRQDGGPLWPE